MLVLSLTNGKQKRVESEDIRYFCRPFWPCSWFQWLRMLAMKRQHLFHFCQWGPLCFLAFRFPFNCGVSASSFNNKSACVCVCVCVITAVWLYCTEHSHWPWHESGEWFPKLRYIGQVTICVSGGIGQNHLEDSPVWVPDTETKTCMHCKRSEFTLINRRVGVFTVRFLSSRSSAGR